MEHPGTTPSVGRGRPEFTWQDFSRFVEVSPVRTGWLVVWGRYEARGRRRVLRGNRVYRDLAGVRRRLADAVLELTGKSALVEEALGLLDRAAIPAHRAHCRPSPCRRGRARLFADQVDFAHRSVVAASAAAAAAAIWGAGARQRVATVFATAAADVAAALLIDRAGTTALPAAARGTLLVCATVACSRRRRRASTSPPATSAAAVPTVNPTTVDSRPPARCSVRKGDGQTIEPFLVHPVSSP